MKAPLLPIASLSLLFLSTLPSARGEYPVERPPRSTPPPAESAFAVAPEKAKQVIQGIGFEIQSDSIASGNAGLPSAFTSVPHDLIPSERQRFCNQMLKGFRYCRLAGGLYWRGEDHPDQKFLIPRWPEQLVEIKEMIQTAGIEGVSFEYWSPSPFWKANRKYTGKDQTESMLRCFGKNFANDPDYKGDKERFLKDFAAACVHDLQTLKESGIKTVLWGLQNEPGANASYSCCNYRSSPDAYRQTFLAVAPAIKRFDPEIKILADSWKLDFIAPVMKNPEEAKWVDYLVVHHIGSDSNVIQPLIKNIRQELGYKQPAFQNEYEYLGGPASAARCLNTVQHIMNWFQLGEAPTWFWIHALKPIGNSEASGYSLGFWRPAEDKNPADNPKFPGLKPGCWTWNKYNWNAVGSFVRHMPWDCQGVKVKEDAFDNDLRIFAFKRPNGKLTLVLSNRSYAEHTFKITTGLANATFKGYRYTPEDSGLNCEGVEIGTLSGGTIVPKLQDMTWEFWEEQ